MTRKRRKLSPDLEKKISLAKKEIELITAIIHDIDDEEIQEEYKQAFLPVFSGYMALDQSYKDVGFNEEVENIYSTYIEALLKFKNEYEV